MDEINALVPGVCPHCNQEIVVKLKVVPPELTGIVKAEDVADIIKKLNAHDTPTDPEAA